MLSQRSNQPEWIDLGAAYYTPEEYGDCLYQLDRIGQLLGGDRASFWALRQLLHSPTSILDVGCGGGLFTLRLATHYPSSKVIGIDLSHEAIRFAQERLKEQEPPLINAQFLVSPFCELDNSFQFDVIITTLVCHHLPDQELLSFLQQACKRANKALIINDLHRHPLAIIGFATIAPLFFRNRLIQHDGLLSIRRSFTRQDWKTLLNAIAIDENYYTITWHWAFRWIVIIDTAKMKQKK